MKGPIYIYCGLLVGIVVGLVLLRRSRPSPVYDYMVTDTADRSSTSWLALYNKTCGIQYWNTNRNFHNKDDIDIIPLIRDALVPVEKDIIIIEFGANTGQFSQVILSTPHRNTYVIHSIEPIVLLFEILQNNSKTFKKKEGDKHFQYNLAISDRPGRMPIYSTNRLSEGATLGKGSNVHFIKAADIAVTTLPDFIKTYGINTPISFIKIDVEGFEPEVISGMHLETNAALFPLFSFETGGTWLDDRSILARNYTLKSFVTMLDGFGYDSFFVGSPYFLPISGENWSDVFDGFRRNPNVLSVLRRSRHWKNLLRTLANVSLDS